MSRDQERRDRRERKHAQRDARRKGASDRLKGLPPEPPVGFEKEYDEGYRR